MTSTGPNDPYADRHDDANQLPPVPPERSPHHDDPGQGDFYEQDRLRSQEHRQSHEYDDRSEHTQMIDPLQHRALSEPPASAASDDYRDRPQHDARPEDRFITGAPPAVADRDRDGRVDSLEQVPDERPKSGFRISKLGGWLLGVVRILLGFEFLWAFIDKTFGLGYATPRDRAWINGGHPTAGFLGGVVSEESKNPFKPMFQFFLDQSWTDWLFMIGLLGIGIALILGVLTWFAAISGAVMLLLMYLASWPIENNPFLDDHLLQAVLLIALAACNAGAYLGLSKAWRTRTAYKDLKAADTDRYDSGSSADGQSSVYR